MIPDFIRNVGLDLPLILLFIALFGFRARVTPGASVLVRAPAETVFKHIDFAEGETQRWQRTRVICTLVDPDTRIYRLDFVTPLVAGSVQATEALFRVVDRDPPRALTVERAGLDGQSSDSQLLKMSATLTPEAGGTRLSLRYHWGPRPLLAQLLARADLWGSAYRLKGLAETGTPDYRTDSLISAGVAVATGIVSLVTFAALFGWLIAMLLVAALLIHEFGHLLAYRLIGQPWGRLVFLPFLGAVAVPRLGFSTQGQIVFAAMMGPAFSVAMPLVSTAWVWAGGPSPEIAVMIGIVACALNLFNLLPVEPLDGGVVLRSVLSRIMGGRARFGLIVIGAAIAGAGFLIEQVLLVVFGGVALVANLRKRKIDSGVRPMSRLAVTISAFSFMSVLAAYVVLFRHFMTFT